jgi:hypothetical protein
VREVADVRVHGTTGEAPATRFARDEAQALKPLGRRAPFRQIRDLVRRVQADCCVEVDGNAYSVPWRLIGEGVRVEVAAGRVRILHGGREVAAHDERASRRERALDPAHFKGIVGFSRPVVRGSAPGTADVSSPEPELLRPLAEYEAVAGGGW